MHQLTHHLKRIANWIDWNLRWFFTNGQKHKDLKLVSMLCTQIECMIIEAKEHKVMDEEVENWKQSYRNIFKQYEKNFYK